MAYDQRKAALGNWLMHSPVEPRRRSRWTPWVFAMLMAFALAWAIISMTDRAGHSDLMVYLWPANLAIILAAVRSPYTRYVWLTENGLMRFDEFERSAIVRATWRAYLFLLILLLAIFGWLALAQGHGWPTPHTARAWWNLGLATLMIAVILPVLCAELMVPLPPADDEALN